MRFEFTLTISVLAHLLLMGLISKSIEFTETEDLPVKARVKISFEPMRTQSPPQGETILNAIKKAKEESLKQEEVKPIVDKTEKPALPTKPVLKLTDLNNPLQLQSQLPLRKPPKLKSGLHEVPKLEILHPTKLVLDQPITATEQKKSFKSVPALVKKMNPGLQTPIKPTITRQKSPKVLLPKAPEASLTKIPVIEKKPVPPSTITSNRSKRNPSKKLPDLESETTPQSLKIPIPKLSLPQTVVKKPEVSSLSGRTQPKQPRKPELSLQASFPIRSAPSREGPQLKMLPQPAPELPTAIPPSLELPASLSGTQDLSQTSLLDPVDLPNELPQPELQSKLPAPEEISTALPEKKLITPILRPEPIETQELQANEPLIIPEAEDGPVKPLLDFEKSEEPEAPVEIELARILQEKNRISKVEQEYHRHIEISVQPKLTKLKGIDPKLFVLFELIIGTSGKIINYTMLEKSYSDSFNQAAELAIRNANLNPLPQALAENPPYIVEVRIVPQKL